jgi:hypothetical protein
MKPPLISCEVRNKNRAGRAPYNFVPLPGDPWRAVDEPPSHASYQTGEAGHSGEIVLEIKALTDFYIRGMWVLDDYLRQSGDKKSWQPDPFQANGKLRLPGSSLRGMFRTLIEILSAAPLDPINDHQLFYRTVASVPDPNNKRSFEPHAQVYKSRLLSGTTLRVEAGYLYNTRQQWTIHPATRDPQTGRQWYRIRTFEKWIRKAVSYDPDGDFARVYAGGREQGWLVCSGGIPGKQKQWVIRAEDKNTQEIDVPRVDVEAYKKGGITREIDEQDFAFTDHSHGVPCFYVNWQDPDTQDRRVAFGHTAYFRMPYATRTVNAVPPTSSRKGREFEWDMARAIFGWVPPPSQAGADPEHKRATARRGRISFEDGILWEAPNGVDPERWFLLGEPKPTTFQHYLVQRHEQLDQSLHWDGRRDQVMVRGHKLYWHRPGAARPEPPPEKRERIGTPVRVAREGAVFTARIRYDNLRLFELGALLTAIKLPTGCRHRLGMGKALGLGSFEITVAGIMPIDRILRYRSFVNPSGELTDGRTSPPDIEALQDRFAAWYFQDQTKTIDHFWKEPRMRELKALLTWDITASKEDWLNITRYLEFGRMPASQFDGRNYNEYNEIGYDDPSLDRPRLEKRRPLPPASQVLQAGPSIPRGKKPAFVLPSSDQRPSRPPRRRG